MRRINKNAFTLVELIVVITILAILGTIAFISLNGYSKEARDSTRISDLSSMRTSLELFQLGAGKYPLPTDGDDKTYSGGVVWSQGTFGSTSFTSVSILDKVPLDPITDKKYVYSTIKTRQEYQLAGVMEGELSSTLQLGIEGQVEASEKTGILKVSGNYNGKVLKYNTGSTDCVLALPSIISASGTLDRVEDIVANDLLAYDGYRNIPYQLGGNYKQKGEISLKLVNQNKMNLYCGDMSVLSDGESVGVTARANLLTGLKEAYTGTAIKQVGEIEQILTTTDSNEIELLMTSIISNNLGGSVVASGGGGSGGGSEVLTGWRDLDPNCDIDDIVIGTQTWAGCNSTLGTGFEYGQTNADIGIEPPQYSGTVGNCYDYSGNNTATCTKGDVTMASNTKANIWFSGTNTNGDSEYANIWGKYYTWSNSPSACPAGRHVPSDSEWEALETYLNGGTNCRNSTDGWLCDGLGWNGHNAKTDTNNLANALKLPLAGSRITDGSTFNNRGYGTTLWSSTPSSTNAYRRNLFWGNSTVYRNAISQVYGFSVRCIKD